MFTILEVGGVRSVDQKTIAPILLTPSQNDYICLAIKIGPLVVACSNPPRGRVGWVTASKAVRGRKNSIKIVTSVPSLQGMCTIMAITSTVFVIVNWIGLSFL